jgi:hypothetical protein
VDSLRKSLLYAERQGRGEKRPFRESALAEGSPYEMRSRAGVHEVEHPRSCVRELLCIRSLLLKPRKPPVESSAGSAFGAEGAESGL